MAVQTPLVQLLNQGNVQQTPANVGASFRAGTKLQELQKTAESQRDIAERQQSQKELFQKAVNINGTSQSVIDIANKAISEGRDPTADLTSFLTTKSEALPGLGFGNEDTLEGLKVLREQGVDGLLKLARDTQETVKPFIKGLKPNDLNRRETEAVKNFKFLKQLQASGDTEGARVFRQTLPGAPKGLSSKGESELFKSQNRVGEISSDITENRSLINDLKSLDISGGVASTVGEFLKRQFGTQDQITAARIKFNKLSTGIAVSNLPPGTASDADVKLALSGVPPANAPASQMVLFLQGANRLLAFESTFNEFKAEYIGQNGNSIGMLNAYRAFINNPANRDLTQSALAVPASAQQPAQQQEPQAPVDTSDLEAQIKAIEEELAREQ